jgi:hypothetical protein
MNWIMELVKKNAWALILLVVQAIVAWTLLNTRLQVVEANSMELENRVETNLSYINLHKEEVVNSNQQILIRLENIDTKLDLILEDKIK